MIFEKKEMVKKVVVVQLIVNHLTKKTLNAETEKLMNERGVITVKKIFEIYVLLNVETV